MDKKNIIEHHIVCAYKCFQKSSFTNSCIKINNFIHLWHLQLEMLGGTNSIQNISIKKYIKLTEGATSSATLKK